MGKKVLLKKKKGGGEDNRCERGPIRRRKEGTRPSGYGGRKRQLVRLDAEGKKARKIKKADLAAALRVQKTEKSQKKSGKKKFAA